MTDPDNRTASAITPVVPTSAAKAVVTKAEAVPPPEDGKSAFTVTPRAGPKVAGQRVKHQQEIRLTEDEAASDLLTGAIVRKGETLHSQLLAGAKPRKIGTEKAT